MASPIRVGFIGLGQSLSEHLPGGWGAHAHLPYLRSSPKYKVVAICNSSIQSSESSIAFHKLGPEVKAYGSPDDIAKDPNVDLIVVSVQVSKHYALTKPALLAGKDVFVEWPLGKNTIEAEELMKIAEEKGVRTIVGAQARASPIVTKIRELLDGGHIGKVTSSTVISSFAPIPHDYFVEGGEYYLDKDSGGNVFTIFFGHFLDSFIQVLGNFNMLTSILKTDYPKTNIINESGQVVKPNYLKTAPDYISVLGNLSSGAAASITYRTIASKSLDGIGIRWLITGTDGELEITTSETPWQISPTDSTVLKARLGKGGEVQVLDFTVQGVMKGVMERKENVTNTARLYEAFANRETDKYQDFRRAVELHNLLEKIRRASEQK